MRSVIGDIWVSTDEQAKEGWSLDTQREKIELYCKLHELNLFEIISDEGISACNVRADREFVNTTNPKTTFSGTTILYKCGKNG